MYTKTKIYSAIILVSSIVIMILWINRKPVQLASALKLAGPNRGELEKVIKYYSEQKPDSLKLKAAEFLIANMVNRYFYKTEFLKIATKELAALSTEAERSLRIDSIIDRFHRDFTEIVPDCRVITSGFLISNIDLAFKVWREQPWGKDISFHDFCDYILPYRLGTEPLENWRESAYAKYNHFLDSVRIRGGSALDAARVINRQLIKERHRFSDKTSRIPFNMGYDYYSKVKIGYCRESSDYTTYVMRALGIPSGQDFVIKWANKGTAHTWNFVLDKFGKTWPFDGTYANIDAPYVHMKSSKKGKVYRHFYRTQGKKNDLYEYSKSEFIPNFFLDTNISDVTYLYVNHNTVLVKSGRLKTKAAYLCVFDSKAWSPIAIGQSKGKEYVFENIESGVVYLPCCFKNEILEPIGYPFILGDSSKIEMLRPDLSIKRELILTRKFHRLENMELFYTLVVHGKFQGAMTADFRNAQDLAIIDNAPEFLYGVLVPKIKKEFRYVRYYTPPKGNCSIAEIRFYTENDQPLNGEVIGGVERNDMFDKKNAFDGNVLSYYRSRRSNAGWIGLDLRNSYTISKIEYAPRNDDNFVKKGDLYELFYHDGKDWVSLGKQQSETYFLRYNNAPENALFLLHDHSGGKEERIFTYENGKQVWW